jgi:hypothetical protein
VLGEPGVNVLLLNLALDELVGGRVRLRPWHAASSASTSVRRPVWARRSRCSTRVGVARERGTDVVVGVVETHGRVNTAAQIGDLEVVPRRTFEHRGHHVHGDGRRRDPREATAVVLVDEFAHTNVPGSRHEKRWQDVEASCSTPGST